MMSVTRRSVVRGGVLGLVAPALLVPANRALAQADEEGDINDELATVAKQLSAFLKRSDKNVVTVGQFTSPPQLHSTAGPGIANILTEELIKRGVEVKPLADLGVKGEYRLLAKEGPRGPWAQIKGDVQDAAGKRRFSFTRHVRGEATLCYLFGLTVDLPASENEEARGRRLLKSVTAPQTFVRLSRVSAGEGRPYAVQVLVKEGDQYLPRAPAENNGLAFVKIKRGEIFAVELINDSDQDSAVTLSVDGLNMFAFSKNTDYSYVIVPRRSRGQILGWHITNQRSDAFQVTEYAKSAVAQLLPNSSAVGTITTTFAAAWPREASPPRDEPETQLALVRGRDATGRGPSVEANYRVVERVVGRVRSSVSVRYTRSE